MWVFIDESGCTGLKLGGGGSSPFFALCAILFVSDEAATAARAAIRSLRADMGWHPGREFKFNKMDQADRLRFLKMAGGLDFRAYSFVLNKGGLSDGALRHPTQMYLKVTGWIVENAIHELKDAKIVFDACGNRDFYGFLESHIRRIIASRQQDAAIVDIRADSSHQNDLLQLADLITGSISRFYSDKADARYYITPIRKRMVPVRFWPSKNDQAR